MAIERVPFSATRTRMTLGDGTEVLLADGAHLTDDPRYIRIPLSGTVSGTVYAAGRTEPQSFSFQLFSSKVEDDALSFVRAMAGDKAYSSWTLSGGRPATAFQMKITQAARKAGYYVVTKAGHVCYRRRRGNAERVARGVNGWVERGTGMPENTDMPVLVASMRQDGGAVSVGLEIVGAVTRS